MRTNTGRAAGALAVLSIIWGYNWVIMKQASDYAGPFQFAALRTVFGTVALFAILVARGQSLRLVAPGRMLLLGLLQTAGFTGLSQWALVSGGAGKTAVLAYTMPFWLLLLAWPLLGERMRGAQWIAVALAAGGLVLIVEPGGLATSFTSELLAVLSGLSWAASAIVAKRLRASVDVDLLSLTAWQLLFGAVVLVVVALLVPAPPLAIGTPLVLAVAYTAFLGTGLAWLLWMYVLDSLPTGVAGLGSLAIPAIGVLCAWLQLGERPRTSELLGMILIAAALALLAAVGMQPASRRAAGA
jgi:drug/metabolite transporter (DMT)-like permease